MDKEAFDRFAETVSKRAYVIAHPDTFAACRENLPRTMQVLDRLVEVTHGQYIPNKWCEPGMVIAAPIREFDPFPHFTFEEFAPFKYGITYGRHAPFPIGLIGA